MRYVIVGAGAIGGVLGARLAQAGGPHPPLLVARGEHGAVIARYGLRIRDPDADVRVRVEAVAGPDEVTLAEDDVLVLATKTPQVDEAMRQWVDAPVHSGGEIVGTAGERLPVLLALNGVESERIATRYFDRVFGVCVWMPAVHLEPGEVIVRIAPRSGAFIVGRYGADADERDRELLDTVTADWDAAGFDVHPVDDVMRWKHRKLLANLGNAVQALAGPSGGGGVSRRLRAEAEEVFRRAGVEWATESEEEAWRGGIFDDRPVPGTPDELGGSSWQSLRRGTGSIETDYLNGEIAALARRVGVEAPLNARVQRLARRASAEGAEAGSLGVDGLEAALR